MPQYKFIAVEGRERKQPEPTKSIRSHAIRAGLEKASSSRARAGAVQASSIVRSKKSATQLESFSNLSGSTTRAKNRTAPVIRSSQTITSGLGADDTQWPSKPSRQVRKDTIHPAVSGHSGSSRDTKFLTLETDICTPTVLHWFSFC